MQRNILGTRIPAGMHDFLPAELGILEKLEGKLLDRLRRWGYQKVLTPALEYAACVQPELDKDDELYKFFDRQGHILALRPEFTTPIARMVGARLRTLSLPLRFCYAGDVYRSSSAQYREFRQVGVELIGSGSALADAEVIALAAEGMRELGVADCQLNLGHMGIFMGLMSELGVPSEVQGALEEKLARKDLVGIESLVRQSDLSDQAKEILLKLPYLHGGEEILDELVRFSKQAEIREAVNGLREVYGYLKDFGVQDMVALDLGILRGFSYYTGVIFEGYVPGVGFPVVEGGRYDALYGDFGFPQPATGFAIHLGSLLGLFPHDGLEPAGVLVYGADRSEVIRRAQALRSEGKRVEMAFEVVSPEVEERWVEEKNISRVEKV